jgi:hypothetical protein
MFWTSSAMSPTRIDASLPAVGRRYRDGCVTP